MGHSINLTPFTSLNSYLLTKKRLSQLIGIATLALSISGPIVLMAPAEAQGTDGWSTTPAKKTGGAASQNATSQKKAGELKKLQSYLGKLHGRSHRKETQAASGGAASKGKKPAAPVTLVRRKGGRAIDPRDDLLIGERESKGKQSKSRRSRRSGNSVPGQSSKAKKTAGKKGDAKSAEAQHINLFVENRYPSAATCGICHPKHYKEWSVSQHAYAQLSPVYLSLNNKINQLSNGSNGDFCLRCHSPVGANLGESPFASNLDRHPASREGITCVVCHRINKAYNKVSGRLALVEGGLTSTVFGPAGNKGVQDVLKKPSKFRVVTDEKKPGRKIHATATVFAPIKTSTFCGSCHDVTLFNGFRLEEAFSEYRLSPAAKKGITCQDCHMGKIQGKPSGYDRGPAAIVGDVPTAPRKLTSHLFSGPDYPVVHPGIFPHNIEAASFKTLRQWLKFDYRAGWGTDKFEKNIPAGYKFPKAWQSVDDRYDARQILRKQFELLEYAKRKRLEVLRNGYILGKTITDKSDASGLAFRVQVKNGTDGHNVPTGFTGERLVWLDVKVRDRNGRVIFKSGHRDPNGDLLDGHSSYVHAGKMKRDPYLFSLQSIFVTQNGRGGEIEHVIPIPFPTFALPRVLPSTTSLVFTGEPATERNHKKGIEPLGQRWAAYKVSAKQLTGAGPYTATIMLKAQAVPVNLIIAMQDVGFDFNMTPAQVGKRVLEGTQVLWTRKLTFNTGPSGSVRRSSIGTPSFVGGKTPSTGWTTKIRKGE